MNDFFQPGLILIATGLIVGIVPAKADRIKSILMVAGPVATAAAVILNPGDKLSYIFALVFALAAVVGAIYSLNVKGRMELVAEAVYAGASISVVYCENWLTLIVFWEMMAIASWLVVVSSRTQAASKAGFRYLLVHMLGGNLLLAGIVIKIVQGSTVMECLTGNVDFAYWLILLGVAINTAIPPLNAWISDAYPESTIGGTVYLGTYTTKVGVYCLIRLFAGSELLLYFGIFMALYGAAMALLENNMRRLFSFHIVSQLGYMVAALALGSEIGIDGAAAHAFNNILYKGTLLMCAGAVFAATGKEKISQLGGLYKKMPLTAICFLIASFAIAGFPLFNGFVSKSLVMNAMAEGGVHWAELLLMVGSVGTLFSITLKGNYFVFFGKCDKEVDVNPNAVTPAMKISMVIGAVSCIVTGIFPGLVYGITPFGIDGHPFTVDHVTQYIELFAAATVAFVMYIDHMKPKELITLDTDWFYRKPLKYVVRGLSFGVEAFFMAAGNAARGLIEAGFALLKDPSHAMRKLFGPRATPVRDCIEKDDVLQKPAGRLVALDFGIFLVLVLIVFFRVKN